MPTRMATSSVLARCAICGARRKVRVRHPAAADAREFFGCVRRRLRRLGWDTGVVERCPACAQRRRHKGVRFGPARIGGLERSESGRPGERT
jgi:hypothetical protein